MARPGSLKHAVAKGSVAALASISAGALAYQAGATALPAYQLGLLGAVLAVPLFAGAALALCGRGKPAANLDSVLKVFIGASPEPTAIVDSSGRILCVNAGLEHLLGCPAEKLVGSAVEDYLLQDRRSQSLYDIQIDYYNDASTRVIESAPELVLRCQDGRRVPVEVTCNPVQLEDRVFSISVFRNVEAQRTSERRRTLRRAARHILSDASTVARASQELLRAMGECLRLKAGVLWVVEQPGGELRPLEVWHREPRALAEFKAACRSTPLSRGQGMAGRVWEEGRPVHFADVGMQENTPRLASLDVKHLTAVTFPVLCDKEVLGVIECFRGDPFGADERLLETLGAIGSQLGRFIMQKRAEATVVESEARKAAVLEAALDAIITVDAGGRVVEFNPAAELTFGYRREDAIGKDMAGLLFPAGSAERFRSRLAGFAAEPGDGLRGERFETEVVTADGREVPAEVAVAPIRFSGQLQFTSFIRDISQRKQAEETLRDTEERLRQAQKMEAVGQLAGGIAHDFNNLLTVINGYSEHLAEALEPYTDLHNAAREICQAGERAARLTRQLLAFSRKQVLEPTVFDLNAELGEMSTLLRRAIGEDIDLNLSPAPDLSAIRADRGQIEQVVMNLVLNARDAMPRGGKLIVETADVELDESYTQGRADVRPGHYVMLAVTDTGCGMTDEVKAHVFEPFFTTKEVGKGTGLGLATVYGIVKQSGGHIALYSEPGHGTTFKVYLPRVDAPLTRDAAQVPLKKGPCQAAGMVLLVEDEETVRAFTKHVLRQSGYDVLEARHGREAIELYGDRMESIDVTVTDVIMPEMTGRDMAQQLLLRQPNMKVLYMSGYTDNVICSTGLLEDGEAFLEKPFTPNGLIRKLAELLRTPTPPRSCEGLYSAAIASTA